MDEINSIVYLMGNKDEKKEQRVHNLKTLLLLLNKELKHLQEEDKSLMRKFQAMRKDINMIKEADEEAESFERSYSLLTPRRVKKSEKDKRAYSIVYDISVESSNTPRRRAYSEKV